jgi:RNA recognition motif-containing protein
MNDHMRKTLEGRRLFVKNLSYDTQWKYLKDHMRQAGDVVRADVFENQYGRSRGIGVVEFRTKEDARNALDKLNKSNLDGR